MSSKIQNLTYKDLNNLAYYATGATINHTDAPPYEAIGAMSVFLGGSWLWQNKKNIKGGFKKLAVENAVNKKIMHSSENIFKGTKNILAKDNLINFEKSLPENEAYKNIKLEAQKAIRKGDYGKLKSLEELKAKADYKLAADKVNIKPEKTLGKISKTIKDKTGLTKLNLANKKALAKSGAYRSASKFVKAGGGMALVSAAFEAPNVYETYKTLGTKSGNKQLAKSAVNVAAEAAGWVVGVKSGAALGAAIGSVVPGVGTAVGAVIGVACGFLGSWLFGKASRAIVGKDELEIAQQKQAEMLAKEAENDPEVKKELALATVQRLEQEGVELSEDGKTAKESLERVITSQTTAETTDVKTTKVYPDNGLKALYSLAGDNLYSLQNNTFNQFSCLPYNNFAFTNPFMFGAPMNMWFSNPFKFLAA